MEAMSMDGVARERIFGKWSTVYTHTHTHLDRPPHHKEKELEDREIK